MEKFLSDRIKNLPSSTTLEMAARARALRSKGKAIISLCLGQPDFNTPFYIKDAAIKAIEDNYNTYSPVDGYVHLKEAIALKFKRDNFLSYHLDQIVVSTGSKQSLANITQVLLNPGDEVLLPAPYWVSYSAMSILSGATYKEIPSTIENDFKITASQLEKAISPKTKLIFFNSPNNPSGTVYTEEDYKSLAEVLEKYPDIYIVSDEIYEHIYYNEEPHFSIARIPSLYERTITVNGLSKAFAMTGWRIGYIGGPNWIAEACSKMQGQTTSGTNSIAQIAAITALTEPISKIEYMVIEFKKRRDLILNLMGEIREFRLNTPKGAFYIFPDISAFFGRKIQGMTIHSASDFSMLLLEKANVATVSGESFGAPNCIRISYSTSEENLREAVERIKNILS